MTRDRALKANQVELLSDARSCLGKAAPNHPAARQDEAGHGRKVTRTGTVVSVKGLAEYHDFLGLQAFGRIESRRETEGKGQTETRHFALSRMPAPEVFMATVRAHWATRNALHWQLDVSFREDAARNRNDNSPANIAILRRRTLYLARSDTSKGSLSIKLKRAGWNDTFLLSLLNQLATLRLNAIALLLRLPDVEQADRQARSLRCQLEAARFPTHRDLTAFDWSAPLDATRLQELAKGHDLETAHNLIPVGTTGTGKTRLAIAPGVAAIHHGKRIRCCNAVDPVNLPEREKAQGKAGNPATQLTRIDAVIPGALGCLPFPASGGTRCRRANGPPEPLLFRLHPSDQPALRKNLAHPHTQSQLRRMGHGLRRCQDDHRAPRPHPPPLRHSRDRK